MRRSHDALLKPTLSEDPVTGTRHRRHHVAPDGFYRGREVIPAEVVEEQGEEEQERA